MKSRLPRYHQIAASLRERIRGGGLAPGTRLDNQRALSREFGVTLMTLRQALEVLEREGLIGRRHGLGTFVAWPSVDYDILQFRSFAGDLSAHGEDVGTRFLAGRFSRADHRVAQELSLRPAHRVFVLERLRLVGGRPMSFQASYLRGPIGEEVAKADLRVTPLGAVLAYKLGIEIAVARETVSAVSLPGRAARELGCRPGIAAFRSDRVSAAADGMVVVYDRVFIPGDRFRITRELHYEHPNGSSSAQRSGEPRVERNAKPQSPAPSEAEDP